MQRVSSRIWTRVAVSISYDDNHYNNYVDALYTKRNEKEEEPLALTIEL